MGGTDSFSSSKDTYAHARYTNYTEIHLTDIGNVSSLNKAQPARVVAVGVSECTVRLLRCTCRRRVPGCKQRKPRTLVLTGSIT